MPNQLLVMDVDGTQPLGSPAFKQVVRQIIGLKDINGNSEVGVTIATGYVYPTLRKNNKKLGYAPNVPMILENGGSIADIAGSILAYHPLTANEMDNIKALFQAEQKNIRFAGFCPKGSLITYYLPTNAITAKELIVKHSVPRKRLIFNIDDFLARCLVLSACQIFMNVLQGTRFPPYGIGGLNHHFSQRSHMYGFLHHGIDKGEGVRYLMRRFNVPSEAVMLVGDDYNDIPMFLRVPGARKIAVGTNCPLELSSMADVLLNAPDDLTNELRNQYLAQP